MKLVELGTILKMEKGKKPVNQTSAPEDGLLPYVDIDAFEKGTIKQYTDGIRCTPCDDGDILIVCDGSRSGLVGKAIKGYVGSTLAKLSAPGLNRDYLYYFVQGKYALLNTRKKGTGTPHLNPELLKKQKLVVPDSVEQEHIVARIEELFSQLDSGVETLKTVKRQLAVYRQAVLKNVFDSISNSYDVPILSVCDYIIDCPHSTPKWTQAGKLCLRTTNFRRGYLDLSEKNYVSDETYKKRTSRLTPVPGDVLFSREGAILGIACIIPDNLQACMGQRMMLLRPNEQLNNKYLMYYLNSSRVNQLVVENVGGSASPHINVGDIKKFPILMIPIEMQRQLVSDIEARLSICDSIEKNVDAALQQAEAMHQSILKQAFEGKL